MRQQLKIQAGSIAPPMSIKEVKAMLDTTEKGGVRNSIKNCLTVFQHDPLLSGAIAYNLLTDRTDVVKPIGYVRSPGASMTDTDMKYIRLYLEENYDLTSEKKIMDAADLAAHQNSYHPVRGYLNSLTWDGTERIRYCLHHFLGADADEYTFQALRLFLLGAIHRAFHPGCKFEVMLCLVGGQGAGKSTFFRLLAGKDEWFSDDLRKLDDENVYDELSNDGGESAIRPAIVFAKHIEMSELCNNSACFSAEIKGTSDICVTFEFYNNPQKESSERGIVCYQTAGRRKKKKAVVQQPY